MSKVPQVQFFDMTGGADVELTEVSGWSLGDIQADTSSDELSLRIWNNRNGTGAVTDHPFTSNYDVAVDLGETDLVDGSETVTTSDGMTEYDVDVDYTMNYETGEITVLSSGSMANSTEYHIDFSVQPASFMQDCAIFALDQSEAQAETIITDGWIKAKCPILNDTYEALEPAIEIPVGAEGLSPDPKISGNANDGLEADDSNYADVNVRIDVPFNATHGNKPFYIALKYFYT